MEAKLNCVGSKPDEQATFSGFGFAMLFPRSIRRIHIHVKLLFSASTMAPLLQGRTASPRPASNEEQRPGRDQAVVLDITIASKIHRAQIREINEISLHVVGVAVAIVALVIVAGDIPEFDHFRRQEGLRVRMVVRRACARCPTPCRSAGPSDK